MSDSINDGINNAHFMRDDKGRPNVKGMTDRELAEETVVILRATQDLVERFMADLPNNPLFGMLSKFMR